MVRSEPQAAVTPTSVLDTSVLVRYLTNDDQVKAVSVRALLQSAPDASLHMPNVAVAELAFVLLRVYRWPVPKVSVALRAVVTHRSIEVPDHEIWLDVADDLEHGPGVVDSYLVRTAERMGVGTLLTFDEGIKPLPTVACIAP
jgi:predicted nucleic acid-binding protein